MTTSRVAAYVEEPHSKAILASEHARSEAVEQAGPFLEQCGWRELVLVGTEWDDHPQVGSAFYIYFRGRAPGKPSFVQELGGVDCLLFVPKFSDAVRP